MNRGRSGFTLIELSVALALLVILTGMVIVRFSLGSARQKSIQSARTLGNLISTYREKALAEEALYVLRLDLEGGAYCILKPAERSLRAIGETKPIKEGRLDEGIRFGKVRAQNRELTSPVLMMLEPSGVLPETCIEITSSSGAVVTFRPDPVANEVAYDQR